MIFYSKKSKQGKLLAELKKCSDPDLRKIADDIHYNTCYKSHTDECGYGYGGWGNVSLYAKERIELYKKAERLVKKHGLETIKEYEKIRKELYGL